MEEATIPVDVERWLYEHVDWADPLFAGFGPGDDDATSDKETEQ
tara:strand:- start:355 stop:486 length:132 start_codon:yes stop_codon:yes gene_type:complete